MVVFDDLCHVIQQEEEERKNQDLEDSSTRTTGTPCVPIPEFNWTVSLAIKIKYYCLFPF